MESCLPQLGLIELFKPQNPTRMQENRIDALAAEQALVGLDSVQVWRHSECNHVLMWREAGVQPLDMVHHVVLDRAPLPACGPRRLKQ
jgi:hypothetical protein